MTTSLDTIKCISGETLVGKYDDTYPQRDYGTGQERRVRFITEDTVYVLKGTTMSDRMRIVSRSAR